MKTIWMFTKWYPNLEDPQLGIFIRKHAQCISINHNLSLLYVHTLSGNGSSQIIVNRVGQLHEVIVYLRKPDHPLASLFHFFHLFSAYRKGIREMKKVNPRPDCFHGYILLRTALIAKLLSVWYKKPYVLSEQWSGYATGRYSEKKSLVKYLTKWLVKKANGFSAVSNYLLRKIHENGLKNNNEVVIGNVVNRYPVPIQNKSEIIRVLLVADLVDDIKNLSGVLKMIASLSDEQRGRFHLRIIGAGKDTSALQSLAEGSGLLNKTVYFEGLKTNDEVYNYLRASDFLIMNSRFETFSAICVEALSCGLPVLATDCGGPGEYINEQTGKLIAVDAPEELKSAFLSMLQHHKEYHSEKIIEYVKNRFDESVIAKQFDAFYQSVR